MKNFIECTVVYEKAAENGTAKLTKETVIVKKAETFGEAEQTALQNLSAYSQGITSVVSARERKYAEAITTDDETCEGFYETKIDVITIDELTGKDRHTAFTYLVQASDIDDARKKN